MFSTTRMLLWCVLCLVISSGTCAVYNMTCDPGSLVLNNLTTSALKGTVDTSVINPTGCLFGGTKVIFRLTPSGGTADDICEVPLPGCTPGFHPKGRQECQCESSSGNFNTYQMKFFFDERYLNGVLQITSNCVKPGLPPPVVCENITDLCLNKDCNGHGTCNRATGGTCDCDLGYGGDNCVDLCLNKDCNGHGTCIRANNGTCDCDLGYVGDNCELPNCDICKCSDCKDHGGCYGCICTSVITILFLIVAGTCSCYCWFPVLMEKNLGPIYRCIDRCLCKKKSPDPKGPNPDEGTSMAGSADKPTNPNSLPLSTEQPTIPNSTKRGKQTAEKSDMNELRDIPSSPDQDERSHPAKGSRDLPQPRAGGGGQGNVTHSSTPRSLLPVQAVTPLPSVERNSYAESRKLPLPSIDSKDAH